MLKGKLFYNGLRVCEGLRNVVATVVSEGGAEYRKHKKTVNESSEKCGNRKTQPLAFYTLLWVYKTHGLLTNKLNKMKKFKVKEDCFCEGYLHEKFNYPREGLVEKKLLKDDEVELKEEWSNFYGSYLRVIKDGKIYDILHKYLQEIR